MQKNNVNSIRECINAICCFAKQVNLEQNKSLRELFRETRYKEYGVKITIENIENTLKKNPDYIDDWLLYSQNKRCTPAWYFVKQPTNVFVIGYLDSDGKKVSEKIMNNSITACAYMIRMEMDELNQK
ncbi:MAG: hypothetical protein HQL27_09950 [Candidatus Omnitrophica bacterium]|nr:hypothetical protein [Candidatus Omnitrophota bacterium]